MPSLFTCNRCLLWKVEDCVDTKLRFFDKCVHVWNYKLRIVWNTVNRQRARR